MNPNVKWLLLLSLCLNLLLGGMVVGHALHRFPPRSSTVSDAIANLPPARQEALNAKLETLCAEKRANWQSFRAAREDALATLTTPDYDPRAYLQRSEKVQALMGGFYRRMNQQVAAFAGTLSESERQAFAGMLKRPPRCGGPEDGKPWRRDRERE